MTLMQAAELGRMAKEKGYVLCASSGRVQFQVLNSDGDVELELEVTDWLTYDEAKELLEQE